MTRLLISAVFLLLANAIGLFLASYILDGFGFDLRGFVIATLGLSIVVVLLDPLLTRISQRQVPALRGGVALITTFIGLGLMNALVQGFVVGGATNWLLATVIVWAGALIASVFLPMVLFRKSLQRTKR